MVFVVPELGGRVSELGFGVPELVVGSRAGGNFQGRDRIGVLFRVGSCVPTSVVDLGVGRPWGGVVVGVSELGSEFRSGGAELGSEFRGWHVVDGVGDPVSTLRF